MIMMIIIIIIIIIIKIIIIMIIQFLLQIHKKNVFCAKILYPSLQDSIFQQSI